MGASVLLGGEDMTYGQQNEAAFAAAAASTLGVNPGSVSIHSFALDPDDRGLLIQYVVTCAFPRANRIVHAALSRTFKFALSRELKRRGAAVAPQRIISGGARVAIGTARLIFPPVETIEESGGASDAVTAAPSAAITMTRSGALAAAQGHVRTAVSGQKGHEGYLAAFAHNSDLQSLGAAVFILAVLLAVQIFGDHDGAVQQASGYNTIVAAPPAEPTDGVLDGFENMGEATGV